MRSKLEAGAMGQQMCEGAHHQAVKLYYTASGIVTLCRWPSGAQVERESPLNSIWYHHTL